MAASDFAMRIRHNPDFAPCQVAGDGSQRTGGLPIGSDLADLSENSETQNILGSTIRKVRKEDGGCLPQARSGRSINFQNRRIRVGWMKAALYRRFIRPAVAQASFMRRKIPPRPYFYLGGNWALTQLSTGHLFYVNTDDRQITPWIISGGTWENFVDDIIWEYVRPGMTVIDIGANLGYYTIKMGAKVGPSGRVFSFEPNPQLVPFLAQNISINGFDRRCTLFAIAVGDQAGKSELVVYASGLGGSHINELSGSGGACVQVEVDTLDNRLSKVERVDFLKIDAEGYEPLILKGAQQLLRRSPDCALILEVMTSWERFGSIPDLLRPISRNKAIFAITHETKIVRVELEQVRAYMDGIPDDLSYFLILPDRREFLQRVSHFRN
jgi:FkbM family methyltransferase